MSTLYRRPSIDASYQVSVHFGKAVSEENIFKDRPIRNKNCLWRPCLLMDQNKILHRGPSIDASYHVSVHLAEGFQRRRLKCEKLTDNIRRMPSDVKSSHCLWQGELITWLHCDLKKSNKSTVCLTFDCNLCFSKCVHSTVKRLNNLLLI